MLSLPAIAGVSELKTDNETATKKFISENNSYFKEKKRVDAIIKDILDMIKEKTECRLSAYQLLRVLEAVTEDLSEQYNVIDTELNYHNEEEDI